MTDLNELNKQVAEWLGVTPYESISGHMRYDYPNWILDPVSLLRELAKRDDIYDILDRISPVVDYCGYIPVDLIIDQTGQFLLKVSEFPAFKEWRENDR